MIDDSVCIVPDTPAEPSKTPTNDRPFIIPQSWKPGAVSTTEPTKSRKNLLYSLGGKSEMSKHKKTPLKFGKMRK